MFLTIRNRLILVGVLVVAAILALIPRKQTVRERGADGVMRDTKVTRVPLKRGLDLQGGMHLALELDQSKRVSADPKQDIDLALTVLRKRIDEFGVDRAAGAEGRQRPDRGGARRRGRPGARQGIVQKSAFLEFRITDKTGALEKALPAMDRQLRGTGRVHGAAQPRRGRQRGDRSSSGATRRKKGDATRRRPRGGVLAA